jgi:hypothetical protein
MLACLQAQTRGPRQARRGKRTIRTAPVRTTRGGAKPPSRTTVQSPTAHAQQQRANRGRRGTNPRARGTGRTLHRGGKGGVNEAAEALLGMGMDFDDYGMEVSMLLNVCWPAAWCVQQEPGPALGHLPRRSLLQAASVE